LGTGALMKGVIASRASDPDAVAKFAKFERLSASPGAMKALQLLNFQIDVGHILPAVRIRHSCCTGQPTHWSRSSWGATSRRKFPLPNISNIPAAIMHSGRRRGCIARRHRRVHHRASRDGIERSGAHPCDRAVHRHCRFNSPRCRNGRSELASVAGQS